MFSLEDEEGNNLFITQESSEKIEEVVHSDSSENFLGIDPMDFKSPCASFVADHSSLYQNEFSDISDDELQEVVRIADSKDR